MAALLTLADAARRFDPNGAVSQIAELLSQLNEIFRDMLWLEGNLPTGHVGTVRTGLPQGTYRLFNQGVAPTKSLTAKVQASIGELVGYSVIDRSLARLNGNVGAFRTKEDNAFLMGMNQQQASTFMYGNALTSPQAFTGFSPLYSTSTTTTAQNAKNVVSGGGTASANTSMWLISWGDNTCYGIYPKGGQAGLVFENKGDIVPAYDSSSNRFEAYTSMFMWQAGLFLEDWRYVVRFANIDTTTTTKGLFGTTPPDLFAYMIQMVYQLPTCNRRVTPHQETDAPDEVAPGIVPAFYMNRKLRLAADQQAIRQKNVLLSVQDYAGEPIVHFRGIPMRTCDAILNNEAAI